MNIVDVCVNSKVLYVVFNIGFYIIKIIGIVVCYLVVKVEVEVYMKGKGVFLILFIVFIFYEDFFGIFWLFLVG